MTRRLRWLFVFGDCAAGALTAVVTAAVIRSLIHPGFDMAAAMMIGMAIGTVVHLVLGIFVAPLLGMFETMVSGMFVGMYGGMLFGMRDAMQRPDVDTMLIVAVAFGVAVTLGVEFWNVQLRRRGGMHEPA